MSAPDLIANANEPWNVQWSVSRSADYIPGLYRMHQLVSRDLLQLGSRLTGWEAAFLQTLTFQSNAPTKTQAMWLRRIERDHLCEGAGQ